MGDHYIPRLLLRRFAAEFTRSGEAMIFQFQRGRTVPAKPFAVGSIASEAAFYGHPNAISLDDEGMHAHEKEAGRLLVAIEGGDSPENHRQALAMLISTMMSRTRAFREDVTRMLDALLDEAHQLFASQDWSDAIKGAMRKWPDEEMLAWIAQEAPAFREQFKAIAIQPGGMKLVRAALEKQDLAGEAGAWMAGFRSTFAPTAAAKRAQVEALLRVVQTRAITWHHDMRFEVHRIPSTDERLILGDSCVVSMGSDDSFGHPMKFGQARKATFLPIAPRLVIVATLKNADTPQWSSSVVNRASAQLSREFFFSAECGPTEKKLLGLLSTAPPPVTCEEVREIARESIGEIPKLLRNLDRRSQRGT